ncbi:MAG TPA: ATP-dependent DNA helicase [Lachnospiraceae bacterium]
MKKKQIRISVRNLVEFVLRSGDLDNRRNPEAQTKAMLKGSKLHSKLQRQMKGDYKAEVALSLSVEFDRFILQIEGRADGIFTKDIPYIDEIKGTYRKVDAIEEVNPVHLAQAKCYAYFWAKQNEIDKIGVRMTYGNLAEENIRYFWSEYTQKDLDKWFWELIELYKRWILLEMDWVGQRNSSIQKLTFPFSYRKGQRDLVAGVYRSIEKEKILLAQAPTGIGKTMSVLYPSIQAMEKEKIDKIFYLTAKTSTATVANNSLAILRKQGLSIKSLFLTAKEKICCNDEMVCNPDSCPYAKGHFDRINDAVFDFLKMRDSFELEVIKDYAKLHMVCPFELSLDLSLWVDIIICDYNYAFDPNVYLKRFFGEGKKDKYIFLVDEAHNLVDRARDMYSANLQKSWIEKVRKKLKNFPGNHRSLMRSLGKLEKVFDNLKDKEGDFQVIKVPDALILSALNLLGKIEEWMEEVKGAEEKEWILDFYFDLRRFVKIGDFLDENYLVYREENGGDTRIKLYCLNPARNMQNCFDKAKSVILFSATFWPLFYYQSLLTEESNPYNLKLTSPFDEKKRLILIGGDVTTLYKRRGEEEYNKIAHYIQKIVWQKRGNYLVFFTSYDLLKEVEEVYRENYNFDRKEIVFQRNGMSEEERKAFLGKFEEEDGNYLGFCIMGGVFGEGIDLVGDKLIGSIVCGTGLPQISRERELLRDYYDKKTGQGFDYAYRYPGMNKVLQSAGRVIRQEEDRGLVVLLDERFLRKDYDYLFPEDWKNRRSCNSNSVEKYVQDFWKGEGKN